MEFKIKMTNDNKNTSNNEQIKNRDQRFYSVLKKFLERDDFGFFKMKSGRSLSKKVVSSEKKIQELLDLKKRAEQVYTALVEQKKKLIVQNKKNKESLIQKLESEVAE